MNMFIEKAKEIHGDKYDYSLVEYKNNKTKIKIICKEHGIFEQSPYLHLKGSGCPKCYYKKLSNQNTFTINEFIEKAKNILQEWRNLQ